MLTQDRLDEPIAAHVRRDFIALRSDCTIAEALETIRGGSPSSNPLYFYVVDGADRLVGVLPTRALLTLPLTQRVETAMLTKVIAIPVTFTLLDACEYFALHKLLAFPVVDGAGRLEGVVDVGLFTSEMFDVAEREQMNGVFETLGLSITRLKDASPWSALRLRFPWLLATIVSGTLCAFLVGAFEATLAHSLVLAFFLTLVLGLGESVSVQTMTLVVYALRQERPSWAWYFGTLRRELSRALLLALASAAVVGAIVGVWKREPRAAAVVAGGVLASLLAACALGVTIPACVHRLKLDLRIAAGPVTLATTDVTTILIYFVLAAAVLGH